ncbi:MAG: succinate dehydrogenase, cytochrome b556 subunit [Anaerolineales bacterium]|nr:succinate dehydrogenase, cytochrome b556 subunit [Anaerolineales bacterium]MCB8990167.1 succinate dehydrogenase, cytochrome b556 subunit [Ardenticatenaceae bacterium]
MSTLLLTLRESVRYRGRSGHWSWIAHRLSGLAILSFLLIHVWDTANATYAPAVYEWSVALFKHPLFGVGEIGIMAAVLYHAFNGIRITLLDFKPEWWKFQRQSATFVWVLFLVIFIPIGIYMFMGILEYCSHGASCWAIPPYPSS